MSKPWTFGSRSFSPRSPKLLSRLHPQMAEHRATRSAGGRVSIAVEYSSRPGPSPCRAGDPRQGGGDPAPVRAGKFVARVLVCGALGLVSRSLSAAPAEPPGPQPGSGSGDSAGAGAENADAEVGRQGAAITPPRLMSASVEYPPSGSGGATVVLELVIERDGSVALAQVVTGEEPFASAAADAALRWQFEPAHRAGQPVAARIR